MALLIVGARVRIAPLRPVASCFRGRGPSLARPGRALGWFIRGLELGTSTSAPALSSASFPIGWASGPPSPARHPWVPFPVHSRTTALSLLDPWLFLPFFPPYRRRCRFWRRCSRRSSRLGDGVPGLHVTAGRRARGDQEGNWLWVRAGGGNAAERLRLASGPRATVAEVWRWGPGRLGGVLGSLQRWSFGDDGGPVLKLQLPGAGQCLLWGCPSHQRRESWSPVDHWSRSFLFPLLLKAPRTLFLYLSSHQPQIQELWMDSVENLLSVPVMFLGKDLKPLTTVGNQTNSCHNRKNKSRKWDRTVRLWKTGRDTLKNQESEYETSFILSLWRESTDTVTTSFLFTVRMLAVLISDLLISTMLGYFMQSPWKLDMLQKPQCEFVLGTDFLQSSLFLINWKGATEFWEFRSPVKHHHTFV